MSIQKLAIFDIDGTIAVNGEVPEVVVEGLLQIQKRGFLTTVSTGRSFPRVKLALGANFESIVSPNSLIIVEHGTKIVDRTGVVVRADYFDESEISNIVNFMRSNERMIAHAWFDTPNPDEQLRVWVRDASELPKVNSARGAYAEVFHSSYDEFQVRLLERQISSLTVKLQSFVSVENLKLHFAHSEIDCIFQDGTMNFVRNISDKAKAVLFLEQHSGVAVKDMLLAGNAINDLDMLNLSAGRRILVGRHEQVAAVLEQLVNPEQVIRVNTPEDLGTFLKNIEE